MLKTYLQLSIYYVEIQPLPQMTVLFPKVFFETYLFLQFAKQALVWMKVDLLVLSNSLVQQKLILEHPIVLAKLVPVEQPKHQVVVQEVEQKGKLVQMEVLQSLIVDYPKHLEQERIAELVQMLFSKHLAVLVVIWQTDLP